MRTKDEIMKHADSQEYKWKFLYEILLDIRDVLAHPPAYHRVGRPYPNNRTSKRISPQ